MMMIFISISISIVFFNSPTITFHRKAIWVVGLMFLFGLDRLRTHTIIIAFLQLIVLEYRWKISMLINQAVSSEEIRSLHRRAHWRADNAQSLLFFLVLFLLVVFLLILLFFSFLFWRFSFSSPTNSEVQKKRKKQTGKRKMIILIRTCCLSSFTLLLTFFSLSVSVEFDRWIETVRYWRKSVVTSMLREK